MSCPICNKETDPAFRPFCSKHCADIDLGRWFTGHYRVPSFRQDNEPETSPNETNKHTPSSYE